MKSSTEKFIIYGRRPVYEALRSNHKIHKLILARELPARDSGPYQELANKKQIKIELMARAAFQRYCGPVVHQGIAAEMPAYRFIDEHTLLKIISGSEKPMVLILDQIQDTHNLGAIMRTAEICGVSAVILPEKTSAGINPTVAKTSAGAIFHLPIHQTGNLSTVMEQLKNSGLQLAALVPGQQNILYESRLNIPLALIIGSEGKGVRKNILNTCDIKLTIPQVGRLDSLNASVSTAVVLFEIMRQRMYFKEEDNRS